MLKKVKIHQIALLILFSLVMSGCRVDVTSDLYTQDILANENLTFPTQMGIQIPGCDQDSVDELSSQVLSLFSESSKASISGCADENMESMLMVNFTGQIVDTESSYDFAIYRNKRDDRIHLAAAFSPKFQTRVDQLMSSQMASLEYDGLKISTTINNDLSNEVEYLVSSGWVDGKAGQNMTGSLQRREKILVTSPDVVSDLMLRNEKPELIAIRMKSE